MSKDKKIRWAILGAGKIANKFAQDFKVIQNGELVAVASSDKERAIAFAAQYQVPFSYSYDELYDSKNVDAVYIATTHNFHYKQTLACLQHGKAVLCEKPITVNDAQFKKLADLAKEKKLFLMEAMWTYFLPAMQKAKAWITEGRIGNIKAIQADFGFKMEYNPSGRLYNIALAGGALLDLGIYPIAFAAFFMNRQPQSITASGVIGNTHVDESTAMVLKYDDGTVASLFTTMIAKTQVKGFVFGDNGYIEIPLFFKAAEVNLYDSEMKLVESFKDDRTTHGYHFETQEATDCILQGLTESSIMPLSASDQLQATMMEVRRQIGLKYPEDSAAV